jgi:CheY-like chemotaxis protein
VTFPIEKADFAATKPCPEDSLRLIVDTKESIANIRKRALGKTISIVRTKLNTSRHSDVVWTHIKRYCSDWFGFLIRDLPADIVIADQLEHSCLQERQRILIVHDDIVCVGKQHSAQSHRFVVENICQPLGPFKLARSLIALMDLDSSRLEDRERAHAVTDAATQTPAGSPQERTMMGEIIMTNYGLTPQIITMGTQASRDFQERQSKTQTITSSQDISEDDTAALENQSNPMTATRPCKEKKECESKGEPPLLPTSLDSALASGSRNLQTAINSLNILAVDDNSLNLRLLNRYLSKRGEHNIVLARNGVEAVEAVRNTELGKEFDGEHLFPFPI